MVKKSLTIIVSAIIISGNIFASGFQINEHAARAMAMGGAFTAVANDASAAMFNPAAVTQLKGTHISAGVTLIKPYATFRGVTPDVDEYSVHDALFTPINLHVTHQISEDLYSSFSLTNPFGLGTTWDDDWIGKYLAVETEVRTFFFGGNLAYKLTENFSVAAGVNVAYGDVIIRKFAPLPDPLTGDIELTLEGDAVSYGYNLSMFYIHPKNDYTVGVSFRSNSTFDFEGEATSVGPAQLDGRLPAGNITATLVTPYNLQMGMSFFPIENLRTAFDFQWVGWSSYDKLAVDFEDEAQEDVSAARDYQDSWIMRTGFEYICNESLDLRWGIFLDRNPVKNEMVEPSLPDSDRLGFNAGFGYKFFGNQSIDLAYMYIRFFERTVTGAESYYTSGNSSFDGTYNSYAHLLAINYSYKF